jgi:hypothetical protein
LSLVLDTQDPHYSPARNGVFSVDLVFSGAMPATLNLPVID